MNLEKANKFFKLAEQYALIFSKDPSTKVGALFLAKDSLQMISMGYNGFPRGIKENDERWEKPQKYFWVEHAERNGIANACRNGSSLENSIAIITMFPCVDCAKMLIQSGISKIITKKPNMNSKTWGLSFSYSLLMLEEAKIEIVFIN